MTASAIKSNVADNKKHLKIWWEKQGEVFNNRRRVLLLFSKHSARLSEVFHRYRFGKHMKMRSICSIDLTGPSIFNECGKLRVRWLAQRLRA